MAHHGSHFHRDEPAAEDSVLLGVDVASHVFVATPHGVFTRQASCQQRRPPGESLSTRTQAHTQDVKITFNESERTARYKKRDKTHNDKSCGDQSISCYTHDKSLNARTRTSKYAFWQGIVQIQAESGVLGSATRVRVDIRRLNYTHAHGSATIKYMGYEYQHESTEGQEGIIMVPFRRTERVRDTLQLPTVVAL